MYKLEFWKSPAFTELGSIIQKAEMDSKTRIGPLSNQETRRLQEAMEPCVLPMVRQQNTIVNAQEDLKGQVRARHPQGVWNR